MSLGCSSICRAINGRFALCALLILGSLLGIVLPTSSSGSGHGIVLGSIRISSSRKCISCLRGGLGGGNEIGDSYDERVQRGMGGREISGDPGSPMAMDYTPAKGDGKDFDDSEDEEDVPGSAPRRLSFASPEPETHRGGTAFGRGSLGFGARDSSPDLINSPLLHTPLPKGRHGLGGFRSMTTQDDSDEDEDGRARQDQGHGGRERINRFAFSATSPIASLPAGSAGRFKMSRRLTSAPSFRRDFFDIRELGRGEHGSVFRCVRKMDLWPYAVKVLPQCKGARDREIALQEIYALAAQGDNPHAVRYYNAWEEDDVIYIQMELCMSNMLQKWKERGGPLAAEDIARVLSHAAAGLRYMHLHGVVHSDVKPENVYVSPSGLLKLGDFGLVRDVGAGAGSDDGEDGDRRYLALEALSQDADLQAADMFSLGATAYELASASRLPETGPDYAAIRASPRAPPSLPPELGSLIKALMDPDPNRRPTAGQVLDNEALNSMLPPGASTWAMPRPDGGQSGWGGGASLRVEALHSRLLQYEGEMASLLEAVKDMQAQVDYWKGKAGGSK